MSNPFLIIPVFTNIRRKPEDDTSPCQITYLSKPIKEGQSVASSKEAFVTPKKRFTQLNL